MASHTPPGEVNAAPHIGGKPASNLLGIGCVIGAVFAFTTQDMAIKWLSGDYALHQIVLIRALIALIVTLAIFVPLEGGYRNLRTRRPLLHLLRGLAIIVTNMTYFTALATLPLGEATALFFVAPLFITALSVLLLGERVDMRRWIAVFIGLSGVLVMLRPGDEIFRAAALLPVVSALAYALFQIMTRKLGVAEKASTMAFYIQVSFIFVSSGIGMAIGDGRIAGEGSAHTDFLLRAWVWPTPGDALIILGIGGLNAVGSYLISQAYRTSEAGLVAPFEYLAMPLAVFWGVVMWGDWPDAVAWLGITLIGGAGLYVLYRETARGALNVVNRPMPSNR